MKTLAQFCRRLLPVPHPSQLALHMAFFNAPRIYMPRGGDERIRNRTLPQGNCPKGREENSGTHQRRRSKRRQVVCCH
jgi:hypothetical protein